MTPSGDSHVTLRLHILGAINDVVESAELGELGKSSLICELVSLFSDYHEEGASIFLDAFITNKLDQLTSMIPQSDHLRLGNVSLDEAGLRKAVKKSAPLVRGCWKMYFSPDGGCLEFGLFRDSGHPLNVPIDLTFQSGQVGDAKFIRITCLSHNSVRVSTHNGNKVVVHYTNAKDSPADSSELLADLCDIICSKIDEKIAQTCKTYLLSLLSKAVRESHGSLITVVDGKKVPTFLIDCIPLNPAINLSEGVASVRDSFTAIPQLYALESVILGMFSCDGIIVFNTRGSLIAYNAFIKLKASNIVGGARRRAYEALCGKLGGKIKAAFFQSQDGASDFRRDNS